MAKSSKKAARQRARKKQQQQRVVVIAVVIVLALIGVVLAFRSGGGLPPEIDSATAYQQFNDGAFLLDVRTPEEWAEYHVPGAVLIPLDELPSRLSEIPSGREVIVICRSGNRSQAGRDILLQAGFSDVTSVSGGIKAWSAAGFPTVSGE